MSQLALICLGGAVGTGARYLISEWALKALGSTFPYGTLAVNIVGSFLLAILMNLSTSGTLSPSLRLALTTGVMGGFTTFSTFSFETLRFVQQGSWLLACANAIINVFACLVACMLGWMLAQRLAGI